MKQVLSTIYFIKKVHFINSKIENFISRSSEHKVYVNSSMILEG